MPTGSPQKSSDDILRDIFDKNYPESPSQGIFERILNAVMMSLDCDKPRKSQPFDFNCTPDELKNRGVHLSLKMFLSENKLNNLFEFFSKYIITNINTLSNENVEQLISLGTHYTTLYETKIKDMSSTFSKNDIIITTSFINFLSSLFNIHNITEFETRGLIHQKVEGSLPNITFGDLQGIDMLVGHSNKLIRDLIVRLEFNNYSYKEESFLDFLESLGDLGFKLKLKEEFQFQAAQIQNITQTILSSTSSEKFSDKFKKAAAWAFLNKYHDKNVNDIESDCRELFELENCLPPDNESTRLIYEKIVKHNIKPTDLNTVNYQLVIDKLLQGTSDNIDNHLNSLSNTNKLINFLNFFKDYFKQNNTLNETYLKKTFSFCNAFNEIATSSKTSLRNTDNKLDIKYFKMIQTQLALVLNLVKSNSEEKLLLEQTHSISQLNNLIVDVIENYQDNKYSNKTDEYFANIPKSYFDIINYSKDFDSSLLVGSDSFSTSINKVTKACLNSAACNNTQIKKQGFEMLGGMARKLEHARRIHLAKEVINSAKELKDIIKNNSNISDAELGNDVANFLRIRHARSQIFIDKDCKDLFGLNPQDCSNTTTTTPIPETTTSTALPLAVNTTAAPVINQTGGQETSTVYSVPVYELPSTTEIITDIAQELGSRLPSTTAIGATAAHGVGSGLVNIMTQATSSWLRNKGYGKSVILGLSLSLASGILQASYVATFPLMLFKLNQLVAEGNETEAQAQWEMMTQEMLPTFFTSLSLSTGLQLLNYLSENYLSKQSMLKGLVQSIPTLSSLWSFSRNPILTGIHTATAYGVSAAGLFGFNRYYSTKNHRQIDLEATKEEKEMEMENLLSSPSDSSSIDSKESLKKITLITKETLEKMTEDLRIIIDKIQQLYKLTTSQNLRDELNDRLPTLKLCHSELSHENGTNFINACKVFKKESECEKEPALIKLRVLVQTLRMELKDKTIRNVPQNLTDNISKIEGPRPKENIQELNDIISDIRAHMSAIFTATSSLGSAFPKSTDPTQLNKRPRSMFVVKSDSGTSSSKSSRTPSSEIEEFNYQAFP